MASVEALCST